jgi:3-phosphoshikimate 1-carboxyvinyltransferase
MTSRRIRSSPQPLDARFFAVPSKSVTHRALVVAALASGRSTILDPLEADDTIVTREGIRALGIPVESRPGRWVVEGRGSEIRGGAEVWLGGSGTSFRFLLAVAALGREPSRLEGAPRLAARPIGPLVGALVELGADVTVPSDGRGLPASAGGAPLRGGSVRLAGDESSQFASALLLIASKLPSGLDLTLAPGAVSLPYVRLTIEVLASFGACVESDPSGRFRVPPSAYGGKEYRVEGDHSAASYFLAAAAIRGGSVRVDALRPESAQPDARLGSILESLHCEVRRGADWIEARGTGRIPPFDVDLAGAPDLAPTLAAMALFAEGTCILRGVGHLRWKESDRLEVLARNLRSLGREARATDRTLEVGPSLPGGLHGTTIDTASDHRIAMAFAIAGSRLDGIRLDDDACVGKSNPGFWRDFEALER